VCLLLALLSAAHADAQRRRSVRHPAPPATVVTRLAGDGFSTPRGIAIDRVSGAVFIADTGNHVIRKFTAGSVTVFAGSPGVRGARDGRGTEARFALPHAIAVAPDGSLIVADTGNHSIRRIDSSGVVTTIAATSFRYPQGVAVANDGTIFVADTGNHAIRRISGGQVSTLATGFDAPVGIAVAANGTLIVADAGSGAIRRVGLDGSTTTLITGLQSPEGIAISPAGVIFVSSSCSHTIMRIDGSAAVPFAGSAGNAGSNDGEPSVARFRFPRGLAFGAASTLLVADSQNHLIRSIAEVP
jgi:sugar lactone lactonase YvrE